MVGTNLSKWAKICCIAIVVLSRLKAAGLQHIKLLLRSLEIEMLHTAPQLKQTLQM